MSTITPENKEVFGIFAWMLGIIAVYAVVHTFLLEPASDSTKKAPVVHAKQQKGSVTKPLVKTETKKSAEVVTAATTSTSNNSQVKVSEPVKVVKVATPSSSNVPQSVQSLKSIPAADAPKATQAHTAIGAPKSTLPVESIKPQTKMPTAIATPETPSVPTVPKVIEVPKVPTVKHIGDALLEKASQVRDSMHNALDNKQQGI